MLWPLRYWVNEAWTSASAIKGWIIVETHLSIRGRDSHKTVTRVSEILLVLSLCHTAALYCSFIIISKSKSVRLYSWYPWYYKNPAPWRGHSGTLLTGRNLEQDRVRGIKLLLGSSGCVIYGPSLALFLVRLQKRHGWHNRTVNALI